jgi:hypothetical protein
MGCGAVATHIEREKGEKIHTDRRKETDDTPDTAIPGVELADDDLSSICPDDTPYICPGPATDNNPHIGDHDNTRAANHGDNDPLDALFARFWDACLKRERKKQTRTKFMVILESGIDPELIIQGMQRRSAYVVSQYPNRPDRQQAKAPDPFFWLHGECWNDELPGPPPATIDQHGNPAPFRRPLNAYEQSIQDGIARAVRTQSIGLYATPEQIAIATGKKGNGHGY